MSDRACQGCGVAIEPGVRERNRRKWCSDTCRIATYYRRNPQAKELRRQRASIHRRETYVPVEHELTCVCGASFKARNAQVRYCSPRCRYRQHYLTRRGRRAGAERETYTLVEIAERDSWTCGICAENVNPDLAYPDPAAPSIDHVTPLAHGGQDTRANVQLAHLHCNHRKGARS